MTTYCFILVTLKLVGMPALATCLALRWPRQMSRREWIGMTICWPICLAGWVMFAGRFWGWW